MCKRVSVEHDGPDMQYEPYINYAYVDTKVTLTCTNPEYVIECFEDGIWRKFPQLSTIVVDKGCVFRLTRFSIDHPIHIKYLKKDDVLAHT